MNRDLRDMNTNHPHSGRYSYSVTEEGVLNPKYAGKFGGGRVEVFDMENNN